MEIKDVEALAELAKIELPEGEKEQILQDMKGILEYVKVIESVDVEDANPNLEVRNVWREDIEEKKEFSKESIKEQFPDSQDGFLKVEKIL